MGGLVTEATLPLETAAWFRIRRKTGRLIAEASSDSLNWVLSASVDVAEDATVIAGPAVAGGAAPAVAWFDHLDLIQTAVEPPTAGEFRVLDLFPNPGRGQATFVVEAGVPGTYSAQVVDTRGRVLMELTPRAVGDTPERFEMVLSRSALAQGVYYVRVRNEATGDTRLLRFVTLR